MRVDLYSSSFCGACQQVVSVLDQATRLVPALVVTEYNIAVTPDRAEADAVRVTPTTVVRTDGGREVFRAEGVPTLTQVLTSLALATGALS